MFNIHIVAVGFVDAGILQWLSVALSDSLRLPCRVLNERVDPVDAFDARRQQHNSTQILAKLAAMDHHQIKILGVTAEDLFIPILTFVFGEAQLGKQAALISLHRLRQTFYGLPEDDSLLYERCEKEAIHELGHSFGLIHCSRFDCVMHFSNSVEQIDIKSNAFCPECHQLLGRVTA
jgi:archaemetzincin